MGRRVLIVADVFWSIVFGKNTLETGRTVQVDPRTPLPSDAKMVNAQVVFRGLGTQELHLLLESSEWAEQPEGEKYPTIDLYLTAVCIPTTQDGKDKLAEILRTEAEQRFASNPIKFREFT